MALSTKPMEQMTLAELGDELKNIHEQSLEVLRLAETEGRSRETLLDTEMGRITALTDQIAPIKAIQKKKSEFLASLNAIETGPNPGQPRITPGQLNPPGTTSPQSIMWSPGRAPSLRRQLELSSVLGSPNYAGNFRNYMRGSNNVGALMAGTAGSMQPFDDSKGGVFILPEVFSTELIKNVDDSVQVQGLSRVILQPRGALSYAFRMRKTKANTFAWTGDPQANQQGKHDTSLSYGKRVMTPHPIQGSCIIARDLMQNWPQAEEMVHQELKIDLGEKLERAYLTGSGNMQPLGLLTTHVDGISAARNVTTVGVAAAGYDDWVKQKYSLKPQYRSQASWMIHRLVLQDLALLKDSLGRPLWQPSLVVGQPDTILGLPVAESEFMPSTKASGSFFSILGAWQYYYILFDMGMSMQRLDEMGAFTREFIYLFFMQIDAQPMLEEAFSRGVYQ